LWALGSKIVHPNQISPPQTSYYWEENASRIGTDKILEEHGRDRRGFFSLKDALQEPGKALARQEDQL
jgi:hypothetical protein